MKVTVDSKRKAVEVCSFGQPPLYIDGEGKVIPDGFTVRTKCNSEYWIASTRVLPNRVAEYRFVSESNPADGTGDWHATPSGAFENVNVKLGNKRFKKGTNGALLIGVRYPNLQCEIRKRFEKDLSGMSTPTSPAVSVATAPATPMTPFTAAITSPDDDEPVAKRPRIEEEDDFHEEPFSNMMLLAPLSCFEDELRCDEMMPPPPPPPEYNDDVQSLADSIILNRMEDDDERNNFDNSFTSSMDDDEDARSQSSFLVPFDQEVDMLDEFFADKFSKANDLSKE